jgi:hypothetical protein
MGEAMTDPRDISNPKTLAAFLALQDYVTAAADLYEAWEKIGPFDALTECVDENFTEFGEQVSNLVNWRDRVAEMLGVSPTYGR